MFKRKIKFHFEHGISIFNRLKLIAFCKTLDNLKDNNDWILLENHARTYFKLNCSALFYDNLSIINFSHII